MGFLILWGEVKSLCLPDRLPTIFKGLGSGQLKVQQFEMHARIYYRSILLKCLNAYSFIIYFFEKTGHKPGSLSQEYASYKLI